MNLIQIGVCVALHINGHIMISLFMQFVIILVRVKILRDFFKSLSNYLLKSNIEVADRGTSRETDSKMK